MRILHVYKAYYPENFTGIPRVIHELSEGLVVKGVESHVLALYEKGTKIPLKLGRHYVHQARRDIHLASTSLSFEVFGRFRALAEMADVVHYHFPWPLADLLYLLYGRSKPALVTYHSDIVKQRCILPFYAPVMHRFLNSVDAIVATSPNYAETSRVLARQRAKVKVIPIGIGDRPPLGAAMTERWRERVGEGFFLFVGALRYYKGLPFLIGAARQTGLPVVIAGEGDRQGWNTPENVTFVGAVSEEEREALLDLCGVFVFPSHLRSEAFGIALLEAARAGKPIISCEIRTGTSYVNVDGETGVTVAPADAAALGRAMLRLAQTPKERARMGLNARARFERLFRGDAMAAGYLKLYQELRLDRAG